MFSLLALVIVLLVTWVISVRRRMAMRQGNAGLGNISWFEGVLIGLGLPLILPFMVIQVAWGMATVAREFLGPTDSH